MPATRNGVVIDSDGRRWPDDSSALAKRIGHAWLSGTLAERAVRDRGFIHVRRNDRGARVTLPVGRFSLACLAGTMQLMNELRPVRIVVCLRSDSGSAYEMFATVFDFIERAEPLAEGGGIEIRLSRIAIPRGLHNLNLPNFALAHPLLKLWKRERGELTPKLQRALLSNPPQRIVLVRQPPRSSRIVIEHFGAAINMMRPCQALALVGRDVEDMYDRDFGRWTMQGYYEALSSGKARLESMLADIRDPAQITIRARYDRVLLPWSSRGGDKFGLCISLLRNRSLLA